MVRIVAPGRSIVVTRPLRQIGRKRCVTIAPHNIIPKLFKVSPTFWCKNSLRFIMTWPVALVAIGAAALAARQAVKYARNNPTLAKAFPAFGNMSVKDQRGS